MARRSLDRALGVSGALLLSVTLTSGALATTAVAPTAAHAPAVTAKAVPAKADSAKAQGVVKSAATNAKTPAPAKPKLAPPSRLATMPTSAPTRATAMPHPEAVRAALVRKPAPVKLAPANVAQAAPANANANPATAGPRGAVTLSPAKPNTPVPMGIPAGNAKLANGTNAPKSSDARVVAAAATGIPVAGAAKGLAATPPSGKGSSAQVSKMTLVEPTAAAKLGASVAKNDRQGSVTPLPKSAPARTPTATVGKTTVVPTPPALEDQVAYQYNALGRRDPFNSLLEGAFVGDDVGGDAPPDLGGLKVVGIMWGTSDQFAMVEDVKGNSYVLRRGDKVMNGIVEGLKPDAMIVNITVDGQSQSVTVPITRKGDKNANR